MERPVDRFAIDTGWIVECEQTVGGCPTVWEGKAVRHNEHGDEEHDVFIRFRYGILRVVWDDQLVIEHEIGGGLDGIISWDSVKPFLLHVLTEHG